MFSNFLFNFQFILYIIFVHRASLIFIIMYLAFIV